MARSVSVISQTMFTAKAAETNLDGLTSTSQTAIWRLWIYIVAACINVFEQLQDVFRTEMETIATNAVPGTPQWVQDRTFKFQYDSVTPQVIEVVDTVLTYPTVDTTKMIVTRCSVKTLPSKEVQIKVAKATSATDTTPVKLTAPEKSALQGYWALIGFSGINYSIITLDPDRIGITADVYYSGQYASSIQADVIAALTAYFAAVPFDGAISVSKIEDTIQAVTGVTDIKINSIWGWALASTFANRTTIFDLATGVNIRSYNPSAGYVIQEDTATYTFADKLTFIPS